MSHPIMSLQAALVDDEELLALVGAGGVADVPPKGRRPPYVTIARHDVQPRDSDLAPGWEHRVLLQAWSPEASRKAALAIADRVLAVALDADLDDGLVVTHRRHERTETAIDARTGFARAALALRFFTEAAA